MDRSLDWTVVLYVCEKILREQVSGWRFTFWCNLLTLFYALRDEIINSNGGF